MKTSDYIVLALVGLLVTIYRILNSKMERIIPKNVARETILSVIISVIIIPAAMEYWALSLKLGIALTGIVNLFVKVILQKLEKKVEEKIENL